MTTSGEGLEGAVAAYGRRAKQKLSAVAIHGEPEEQLREPLSRLIRDVAALLKLDKDKVTLVGETSLADLKTRPDFAVSYRDTLIGFIEIKAPGKGADPRRFRGHDKEQWQKLAALPNLVYTDGQSFSLWRDGELARDVVTFGGDIDQGDLTAPLGFLSLFEDFFQWEPIVPTRPKQLAEMTARLCRLLRDEVAEQLNAGSPALTNLAADWRDLLFPEATDAEFADGYAQTVTFGLLLARARGIKLDENLSRAAATLGKTHSLMGTALRVVTESVVNDAALKTSNQTMTRVLSVVDWPTISEGNPEAWLYFYEEFLAEYDNDLRKKTGSYYTPVQVVEAMTRLVDEALRTRFGLPGGLAEDNVTILDPAVGTGTFLLAVLRSIAATIAADQGEGAVPQAMVETLERVIAFEMQLGPFAVAQLRLLAELAELGATSLPPNSLRTFVANTLDNPYVEEQHLGAIYEPIAQSRREANRIKRDVPVTVVIGNPPYKERSRRRGGWIESGNPQAKQAAPLQDFVPPRDWGVGAHVKHLYNPYVYFWRWGTWKVFDNNPADDLGIVCFITVAGFLTGPGFEKMRAYLRERSDAVWVIDCSPEGHQPPVNSRIFQGVQQPVCITVAVRDGSTSSDTPASVRYRSLTEGTRETKFAELADMSLSNGGWLDCPSGWRDPFLPASAAVWSSYPGLNDLFRYSGSGVMPGRTWVVAPDPETLVDRWNRFIAAPLEKKPALLQEHPRDRTVNTVLGDGLPGFEAPNGPIGTETGPCPIPVRIGYRSFDRQFIIPDKRLINQPNPTLWAARSERQVHLTALTRASPTSGPAVTFSGLIPDLDHYKGSFGGRVFPTWLDGSGTIDNIVPGLLDHLSTLLARPVAAPDVVAYVAAVAAHSGYTDRFADDLKLPGIRIPLTASGPLFDEAVRIGRRICWLHTYGERFSDPDDGRPTGPPRMDTDPPKVTIPIPGSADQMPDAISYDPATRVLTVGSGTSAGAIANVTPQMWQYEVSGVNVLGKWFSYRRRNREHPTIGNRRSSPLKEVHVDHWPHRYTAELIDLLHVLGLVTELEPAQAELLGQIVDDPLVTIADLTAAGVLPVAADVRKPDTTAPPTQPGQQSLSFFA